MPTYYKIPKINTVNMVTGKNNNSICQYHNYYYCHLDPGLEAEAEARTLEAEAEARTLEAEAEAEARTLEAEAEARTLEAEAEAKTLEAEAEARTLEAKAEVKKFWPSKFNKF